MVIIIIMHRFHLLDDIKKALAFAKEHALRPTVYSSGHDFIGKIFYIFLHEFKGEEYKRLFLRNLEFIQFPSFGQKLLLKALILFVTRMHSSGMRTARLLTVSRSICRDVCLPGEGGQTDTCENITFANFVLRAIKIVTTIHDVIFHQADLQETELSR